MARSIFTIHSPLHWWTQYGVMEWGKSACQSLSFIEKLRHGTLLQKRELLKAYLADVKELSEFQYCCP